MLSAKQANRKNVTFLSSPLALLVLSACGGGGGGGVSAPASFSVGGSVVKGPLSNALVGLDYDGDGVVDSATVRTNADGSYSLTTSNTSYTVIAVSDDSTIDASSGAVMSGITLKAPKGASVVTPTTTLIEEASLTKEQVAEVLGLPDGVDPLTFNPYAADVDATEALAVEKASQQIMSVVNAFAGAAEGAGASQEAAFEAALTSVVEVVKTKASKLSDATASDADKKLDLTNAADLALIKTEAITKVASTAGVNTTAFNNLAEDTSTAVKNVNAKIATVSDLTSDASKNAFSTTQVLADQVKTAATAEVSGAGTGNITFKDANVVDTAASNKAPTDISLSANAISEDASSLVIGTLSTIDDDQSANVAFTYKIAKVSGTDHAAFSIDQSTGVLSLKAQPDYETKSSYNITILSIDEGGKKFSKAFKINVTDVNEAPTLATPSGGTIVEDAATSTLTGSLVGSDPEKGDLSYSIVGQTLSNGKYTAVGTYGTLVLNTADGTYSYSLNNSLAAVDALKANETKFDSFSVQVSDGTQTTSAQTLTVTVSGSNDAPSAPTISNSTIDENVSGDVVGTLSSSDVEGDSFTYFIADSGDGASFKLDGGVLKLKDNLSADYETKSSYEVTIIADDGSDSKSSTFDISVSDTNEAPTLSVPTDGTVSEDGSTATISGLLSGVDPEKGQLNYSVVGESASNGVFTVAGNYGTLILNASSGSYTYTLNNAAAGVQALGKSSSVTETFAVQVTDGTNTPASQNLSFTINGTNDATVLTTPSTSFTIKENTTDLTLTTFNFSETDLSDTVSITLGGADADKFDLSLSEKKITFKDQPDYETKSSYDLSLVADDGTAQAKIDFDITIENSDPLLSITYNPSQLKLAQYYSKEELGENFSKIEQKIKGFETYFDSGIAYTLRPLNFSNTQLSNLNVSSSGFTVTADNGSILEFVFTNFSPTSLAELEAIAETFNRTGDISDINISGGFSAINAKAANGDPIASITHASDGVRFINHKIADGYVDTFFFAGTISNQITDLVSVLASVQDTIGLTNNLTAENFIKLDSELASLGSVSNIRGLDGSQMIFDLSFTSTNTNTAASISLYGESGNHTVTLTQAGSKLQQALETAAGGVNELANLIDGPSYQASSYNTSPSVSGIASYSIYYGYTGLEGSRSIYINYTDPSIQDYSSYETFGITFSKSEVGNVPSNELLSSIINSDSAFNPSLIAKYESVYAALKDTSNLSDLEALIAYNFDGKDAIKIETKDYENILTDVSINLSDYQTLDLKEVYSTGQVNTVITSPREMVEITLVGIDKATVQAAFDANPSDFLAAMNTIQRNSINFAPTLEYPTPDQTATEETAFSLQIPYHTFHDDLGLRGLSYTATLSNGDPLPSWLSFSAGSIASGTMSTFTGTPSNADVGAIDIKLTATDAGSLAISDTFTITVSNVNDAPVLQTSISDQTISEDNPYSFVIPSNTFNDIDAGDSLTFTATLSDGTALPSWLSFDASSQTFSGTPTNDDVGSYNVKVSVSDTSSVGVSDIFALTVSNVNDAPAVTNPIPDQSTAAHASYNYQFPANAIEDVDVGDNLTYTATLSDGSQLPSWLSFDALTRTLSGTPTSGDVGTIGIKITATDTAATFVSDLFDLTVFANKTPTITSSAVNAVNEDATYTYTFTASDDDTGDAVTLSAPTIPSWLTFNASNGVLSGIPTNGDVGDHSIILNATDSNGAITSHNFSITVSNTNDAPTVKTAIEDQTGAKNISISFQVPSNTFEDADIGDSLTYTASLSDGSSLPSWLSFDPATQTFSGSSATATSVALKVTATDTSLASVSDIFDLTVYNFTSLPLGGSAFEINTVAQEFSNAGLDAGTTNYTATLKGGAALPSWVSISSTTGNLSGTTRLVDVRENPSTFKLDAYDASTATYDSNGFVRYETTFVSVTAQDGTGASASADIELAPKGLAEINTSTVTLKDYPVGSSAVETNLTTTLSYRSDVGNVLSLSAFNLDNANLQLAKDKNGSEWNIQTWPTSPELSLNLSKVDGNLNYGNIGKISIFLGEVKNNNGSNYTTIEADEKYIELSFTGSATTDANGNINFNFDDRLEGDIKYQSNSNSLGASVETTQNSTLEFISGSNGSSDQLRITPLDLLDQLPFNGAVGALVPLDTGDFYLAIDGLPIQTSTGEFVDLIDAQFSIV